VDKPPLAVDDCWAARGAARRRPALAVRLRSEEREDAHHQVGLLRRRPVCLERKREEDDPCATPPEATARGPRSGLVAVNAPLNEFANP